MSNHNPRTHLHIEEVRNFHSMGLKDLDIAHQLGLSRERIRQIRTKIGLNRQRSKCPDCGEPKAARLKRCPKCHRRKFRENKWTERTCEICGIIFPILISTLNRGREVSRFCSHKCRDKWLGAQKGRYGFGIHKKREDA